MASSFSFVKSSHSSPLHLHSSTRLFSCPLHTALSSSSSFKTYQTSQLVFQPLSTTWSRRQKIFKITAMAAPLKQPGKAKKVIGVIKLALDAGKATPAPPVGPALGSKGVNIMAFCKEYNAKTSDKAGYVIPVEITIFDDKSFTFILKTPPASVLLKKAAGVEKGSSDPVNEKVGKITIEQLRAIAVEKLPDLNCSTVETAMRVIAGTAGNMGIDIDPPILQRKKKEIE
ncbi:uncharacterized protein LOC131045797 [Cryptomeria japonica]|uniref:uncharacterized protein LOC131045797 n=1 Tax=Cryptomeria japonica TaxID=3369 RepID=UPI0027DA44BC|nr:uncharacterized protein LOC131045797 [Cryptomeria japonica]